MSSIDLSSLEIPNLASVQSNSSLNREVISIDSSSDDADLPSIDPKHFSLSINNDNMEFSKPLSSNNSSYNSLPSLNSFNSVGSSISALQNPNVAKTVRRGRPQHDVWVQKNVRLLLLTNLFNFWMKMHALVYILKNFFQIKQKII